MSSERLWTTELAGQGASWELARGERGAAISYHLWHQLASPHISRCLQETGDWPRQWTKKPHRLQKSLLLQSIWAAGLERFCSQMALQAGEPNWKSEISGRFPSQKSLLSIKRHSRIDPPRLNVLISSKTLWCHRHTMRTFRCPRLPKQGSGAKLWGAASKSSEDKGSHGVQNPTTFSWLPVVAYAWDLAIDFPNLPKPDMSCNSYMPKCCLPVRFGQPISDII